MPVRSGRLRSEAADGRGYGPMAMGNTTLRSQEHMAPSCWRRISSVEMKLHHIVKDVSRAKYCEMIRRLLEMSSSFSLLLRVDMEFKPDTNRIVQALAGNELR